MMRRSLVIGFLAAIFPALAFAHEHQTFQIGEKYYNFTIGSLNEPVSVDDKSGVDLAVALTTAPSDDHADADSDEHGADTPVLGLEKTLKVELIAGDQKRVLDLTTQYGKPGSYKAVFFPTVQTTLTYRVFGEIEGTAVDLIFTCNPAGHPAAVTNTQREEMGPGVARVEKTGSFGCPIGTADLGFPEPAATLYELSGGSGGMSTTETVAIILGAIGFIAGVGAWRRVATHKHTM